MPAQRTTGVITNAKIMEIMKTIKIFIKKYYLPDAQRQKSCKPFLTKIPKIFIILTYNFLYYHNYLDLHVVINIVMSILKIGLSLDYPLSTDPLMLPFKNGAKNRKPATTPIIFASISLMLNDR